MPFVLLAAFAGSIVFHAAALFLPDVDLSTAPEPPPLTAEFRPPPPPPPAPHAAAKRRPPAARAAAEHPPAKPGVPPGQPLPAAEPEPHAEPHAEPLAQFETAQSEAVAQSEAAPLGEEEASPPPASPPDPRLPAHGRVRFVIYRGSQGFAVGRAEHAWDFADGNYRLTALTETSGLAALLKPVRIELESRGKLTAGGLQPERFTTRRNGGDTNENAEFDWNAGQVTLARDGRRHVLDAGTQDLLSFHYQLGYLAGLERGVSMGVATGKKFERYSFAALGEETLDVPAGHFRTLHLRVQTDSTTELWLALDRLLLPVKIRYTDRKGESFEQVATELGI